MPTDVRSFPRKRASRATNSKSLLPTLGPRFRGDERRWGAYALILAVLAASAVVRPAHADPVADFYKGKDLRMIVATTTGTGYDVYARAVARHLPRHIPGNPNVIVQNMPGAGGLTAANHIYAVAPGDGTAFGMIQNTVPFEPLLDNKAARFDPMKMNWLGTPTTEVGLYIVYHTAKIKTLREAQAGALIAGVTGTGSTPAFYGRLFNQIFGLKTKLVGGYPGQLEILLAMENGEVNAMSSPFWSSLKVQRPTWYPQKIVAILFQYGAAPHPDLKDVPFAPDLIKNPADKVLLNAATAALGFGRPFAAPPAVPKERVAALRAAMEATFKDPAFKADCTKQGVDCDDSRTGAQMDAHIRAAYAVPAEIKARLVAMQK
jgi:tripartite-type tricarboxylate transporter receptor subunit TctC